jgi:hypothetical protein
VASNSLASKTVEKEKKSLEVAPVLVILGVLLVIAGFVLVALVTMMTLPNPLMLLDYIAFGMFASGIGSIWTAWHRLS